LVSCPACQVALFPGHAVASQFRAEHYCEAHGRQFISCAGCGRQGPAPQLRECPRCSVRYCPHCLGADAELCLYCAGATVVPPGPRPQLAAWAQVVRGASLDERERKEVASALTPGGGGYVLTWATNNTNVILHGVYRGGPFRALTRLFHRVKEFVVVADRTG